VKKKTLPAYILFALLFISFFNGCSQQPTGTVFVKDGKQYGVVKSGTFRHRWWNYFERGKSYAEGKFYQNAVSDFQEAIRQREKDQRRARTYGMHFIDYFPHRELGIVYVEMGELKKAKMELELSLSQFPSAKAQFYLDRVRKQLIEEEIKEVPPPKLRLDVKSKMIWTRADPVILAGNAEDEHYIKTIMINGVPIFLERSQKQVAFQKKLALTQGRHDVKVEAYNIVGKRASQQVTIVVDREGPMISLENVTVKKGLSGKQIELAGFLYDQSGVVELRINGQQLPIKPGTEVPFTYQLSTDADELELIGGDRLGNNTTARISLTDLLAADDNRVIYAGLPSDLGYLIQSAFWGTRDTRPPEITLKGWTDEQTVYLDKIYLEGQIKDEHHVVALEIQSKPVLRRKGKLILFSQFIELAEGENQIVIRARDEKGHVAEKTISIIRRVPRALQLAERMSLTVLPFEQKGDLTATSDSCQDFLIDALVNQDRFQVVERNKLDIILREQKLSRTNLFDEKTALKIGRLVAAQSLVAGSIIQSRLGFEIIARMIDSETSDILAVVDVYDEVTNISSLRTLSEGLAIKLHREFPLVDGVVVQKKGNSIFSDLGEGKIKIRRRLIVFREEPVKHPVTGKWLGSDNVILGRAQVTQVMPELSKANILDGKTETIKPLDKVITE
jgi:tetratricopeptide (TPR) repeat protein/TolB-like protein